jgi:hypothetical protein
MINRTERADAGTRARLTAEDQRYTGIARHPLARQWMLKRLIEAQERTDASKTEQAAERWTIEAQRVSGELQRCGVDLGPSK